MLSISTCSLESDCPDLDRAFRIATGDIAGNVHPYSGGLVDRAPCLLAGLDYDRPWTRDAAINVWSGIAVVDPELSRNTLSSVLTVDSGELRIGGQYWDAVLWSVGAAAYVHSTGDCAFAADAYTALVNSLRYFESTELDESVGLFRGPAVYGDGVAAYPDRYAQTGGSGSILAWPTNNPGTRATTGVGIPMMTLSTNCVYVRAYEIAAELGRLVTPRAEGAEIGRLESRARALREQVRQLFWVASESRLRYLVDSDGGCDAQEGMGIALAALFGVLGTDEARACLGSAVVEPAGIPCVYPSFDRYRLPDGDTYGRHSGTVWPHIQALYAEACAEVGLRNRWEAELRNLAAHAIRDGQFVEIYHPHTGEAYGGAQERDGKVSFEWKSCARQTWSATGFLRMILHCVLGLWVGSNGISLSPRLPAGVSRVRVEGLVVRGRSLAVEVSGEPGTDCESVSFSHEARPEAVSL